MKRIKFITYYSDFNNPINRTNTAPATEVSKFIVELLNECGYGVDIIAPNIIKERDNSKLYKTQKYNLDENNTIIYPWGFGLKKKLGRINALISLLWLFFYVLFHVKNNELCFVYHAYLIIPVIKALIKIKKIKVFMWVGELYTNYTDYKNKKFTIEFEKQYLSKVDSFIFSSYAIEKVVNVNKVPYLVFPGTLHYEEFEPSNFGDGKIHIVYAGNLNKNKGAWETVDCAKFLDENYHIHILGHDSKAVVDPLKEYIEEVNKKSKASVTYDGFMSGEEFYSFLQKCHVGSAFQNQSKEYNYASFPSKVQLYMGNGLRVISPRIKVIEDSDYGKYIYFTDTQSPEEFANIIKNMDWDDGYNGVEIIKQFHERAKNELNSILKDHYNL